ncbi:coatomer subunit beta-like isoform X2 [Zophobas morio]|uniref:coatomer subunit beta-like isoform X2 n=1 Tax=Zophobas morio TaxID=2755281 RepID=UPI0030834F3A
MTVEEPCYTLISYEDCEFTSEQQLKVQIEKGGDADKFRSLTEIIRGLLGGSKYPSLLMHVIRFILPRKDKNLKKLLLIYFEIVPKRSDDGKLLPQMILVCDAFRKELEHPNEYIRGATLRFLCKLREPDLLEPLMTAICDNLKHKNPYVRRNAVLCIYTIYKKFPSLLPDAPEIIQSYLEQESDMSCRRNAFMMLTYAAPERALEYVTSRLHEIQKFGDILQLMFVELVYKVCRGCPARRVSFIRPIYQLLSASSPAVKFEAGKTLLVLTSAPTAVTAVAKTLMELIYRESDNNVKLVVLSRLEALRSLAGHSSVFEGQIMDLLRCLCSSDLDVRRKVLGIASRCIISENIVEVVAFLRKELLKTHDEVDFSDEYRQSLVRTLHGCAIRFPSVAPQIVPLLLDFLGEASASSREVIFSVREAIVYFPALRKSIIEKLLDSFYYIKDLDVLRATLWIMGEYCEEKETGDRVFDTVCDAIGELPIVPPKQQPAEEERNEGELAHRRVEAVSSNGVKLNTDGSYATQSAFTASTPASASQTLTIKSFTPLRDMLYEGEYLVAIALASTLVKLVLRRRELAPNDAECNKRTAKAILIMAAILRLGTSGMTSHAIDGDSHDWLVLCLRVLSEPQPIAVRAFLHECQLAWNNLLEDLRKESNNDFEKQTQPVHAAQVDDALVFRHLGTASELEDELEASLSIAVGTGEMHGLKADFEKPVQLTGLSDPIFAEALITIEQFDLTLLILVVNQTRDTLHNLCLELFTVGALKVSERPEQYTLAPEGFITIKVGIKLSSSDGGLIFGLLAYDVSGTTTTSCVVLSDISVDAIDYIQPSTCTDEEFRRMWADFEWENKLTVKTDITSLEEYVSHIASCTNMNCLTLKGSQKGESNFYASILYARSIFGEDVLASLSLEKDNDNKIAGHIRVRAKTQGMALSLGDKIARSQHKKRLL